MTIDGYTQPGSSPNTLPLAQGTNAVLNIEINGAGVALAPCWELGATAPTSRVWSSTVVVMALSTTRGP